MSRRLTRQQARTVVLALALTGLAVSTIVAPVLRFAALIAAAWLWVLAVKQSAGAWWGDGRTARSIVAAMIVAVAGGSMYYRSTQLFGLQQTSALFVGVPAIIAVIVVYVARPRSAEAVAMKTVSIALLVSLMLLDEGMLCVLMSAPLFWFVAYVVAKGVEEYRDDRARAGRRLVPGIASLLVVPMTFEGVTSLTTVDRGEVVSVTRVVAAPLDEVARALVATPRFERPRPLLLRFGFPWPEAATIAQRDVAREWFITMRGGETKLNGMEPRSGTVHLVMTAAGADFARWEVRSDNSHMRHFLSWLGSEVRYEPIDAAHTRVSWTIRYSRDLDPAWYFGPLERAAVRLAAGYLIDAVATP